MKSKGNLIKGKWVEGSGTLLESFNPATNALIWSSITPTKEEISSAIAFSQHAFLSWSRLPLQERIGHINQFGKLLLEKKEMLAKIISTETGKPLWESRGEVESMIGKISISIRSYQIRCNEIKLNTNSSIIQTTHRPLGVVAILGPYNFPGHLPNGHIIPALLAGNTVIFKPSEFTPLVGEEMVNIWVESGLPEGVLTLLQGDKNVGSAILDHPHIKGIFFTGSWHTGQLLQKRYGALPGKLLALEMGGNNPLIIGKTGNLSAATYLTLISAFITSGQRCTCARRLILPKNALGDEFLKLLIEMTSQIQIGSFQETPEPFMGPLINKEAVINLLEAQEKLISDGGTLLLNMKRLDINDTFVTPGIIDMTHAKVRSDEEYFGPLLQVIRVDTFEQALKEANNSEYGLSASLISDDEEEFQKYYNTIQAGVINWNSSTTGASSEMPFGGVGKSGNFRPTAFYAADYCSYPIATIAVDKLKDPTKRFPGLERLGNLE